jgi:hypothetical protein
LHYKKVVIKREITCGEKCVKVCEPVPCATAGACEQADAASCAAPAE